MVGLWNPHARPSLVRARPRAERPAAGIVGFGFNAARWNAAVVWLRAATPGMPSRKQISYKDAGVNIDEADRARWDRVIAELAARLLGPASCSVQVSGLTSAPSGA